MYMRICGQFGCRQKARCQQALTTTSRSYWTRGHFAACSAKVCWRRRTSWISVRITRELLRFMNTTCRRALSSRRVLVARKCLGWMITCWTLKIRCLLTGRIVLGNSAWHARLLGFSVGSLLVPIGTKRSRNLLVVKVWSWKFSMTRQN